MTTHIHGGRGANVVSCYCRSCLKEFEINLYQLVRQGSYCPVCHPELYVKDKVNG